MPKRVCLIVSDRADTIHSDGGMKESLTMVPWLARKQLRQSGWRCLVCPGGGCSLAVPLRDVIVVEKGARRLDRRPVVGGRRLVSDPVAERAGAGASLCERKGENVWIKPAGALA